MNILYVKIYVVDNQDIVGVEIVVKDNCFQVSDNLDLMEGDNNLWLFVD